MGEENENKLLLEHLQLIQNYTGSRLRRSAFCEYTESIIGTVEPYADDLAAKTKLLEYKRAYNKFKKILTTPRKYATTADIERLNKYRIQILRSIVSRVRSCLKRPVTSVARQAAETFRTPMSRFMKIYKEQRDEQTASTALLIKVLDANPSSLEKLGLAVDLTELIEVNENIHSLCRQQTQERGSRSVEKNGKPPQFYCNICIEKYKELMAVLVALYIGASDDEKKAKAEELLTGILGHASKYRLNDVR